jgi:pentose-5-phosphate-3-epimerase
LSWAIGKHFIPNSTGWLQIKKMFLIALLCELFLMVKPPESVSEKMMFVKSFLILIDAEISADSGSTLNWKILSFNTNCLGI